MTLLKLETGSQRFESFLLPAPHKSVELVWLKLPVIDEPSSLLISRPLTGHQGMVVELVENLSRSVQPDIGLGRNNVISSGPSLGQRLDYVDSFLSPEEAGQTSKIIMMIPHNR